MLPSAPTFAAANLEDYRAALNAYVAAMQALSAVPTLPQQTNAPQATPGANTAKLAGDKCGPNETAWREANPGKRAPRFAHVLQAKYGNKENFFGELLSGAPEPESEGGEPETPAGAVFDDEDT